MPFGERDVGFGDRMTHRVGRRDDGGLRHRGVFDQHAFELERAQPIVAGFEHVISPADEGDAPSTPPTDKQQPANENESDQTSTPPTDAQQPPVSEDHGDEPSTPPEESPQAEQLLPESE